MAKFKNIWLLSLILVFGLNQQAYSLPLLGKVKDKCGEMFIKSGLGGLLAGKIPEDLTAQSVTYEKLESLNNFGLAKALALRLNSEINGIRRSDFVDFINRPEFKNKRLRDQVLADMSTFGNMGRIFDFLSFLREYAENNNVQYVTLGRGTPADTFVYLQKKEQKGTSPYSPVGATPSKKGEQSVLLADLKVLELLESDPELVIKLKQNRVIVHSIAGWDKGFNPISSNGAQNWKENLTSWYERAEQVGLNKAREDFEIDHRKRLAALGLGTSFKMLYYDRIPEGGYQPATGEIYHRISPRKVDPQDLLIAVRKHKPALKRRILETLYVHAIFLSTPRMAEFCQKIHHDLLALAKERGLPSNQIYFYVPETQKSYQLIAELYGNINQIPARQIVRELKDVPDKSLLVLLDDFAGTGDSLISKANYLNNGEMIQKKGLQIVISPLIASQLAMSKLKKKTENAIIIPGHQIVDFQDTPFYKSLPAQIQFDYADLMDGGYGGKTCLSFPYMSPDNNVSIFKGIPELFTLREGAIKSW